MPGEICLAAGDQHVDVLVDPNVQRRRGWHVWISLRGSTASQPIHVQEPWLVNALTRAIAEAEARSWNITG